MAKWWLQRHTGDGPFFLQVGIRGPHPPYDPTQDYLDMYEDRELPEVIPPDPDAQPKAQRDLRDFMLGEDADGVVHLPDPSPEQCRRQRAHYYANVTMIDRQVGEIIDALEARGDLDDTIIVFTSDHGDALGDHGHSQKWNMYQSTVHVPALVAGPSIPVGRRVTDNVALFDLGPTILEWAGVQVPCWMEASSLAPYFSEAPAPKRNRVFAEHSNDALLTGTRMMTMVLGDRIKLVQFRRCRRRPALRSRDGPLGADQPLGRPRAPGNTRPSDPGNPRLAHRKPPALTGVHRSLRARSAIIDVTAAAHGARTTPGREPLTWAAFT